MTTGKRRDRPRPASAALAELGIAFLALAALSLTGCEDVINELLDNPAPTGVRASDGDYSDRIEVSWSAPGLSSDRWKDYVVDHYEVSWSGPSSGGDSWVTDTGCSLSVDPAERAKLFDVTVEAVIRGPGGTESNAASDDGFAMLATDLAWPDQPLARTVTEADAWYVTMLQRGFTYRFSFAAGTANRVEFYDFKTLDPVRATIGPGPAPAWTCDEPGASAKFYVHVMPENPGTAFTASWEF